MTSAADLAVVCPSRNRPGNVRRLAQAFVDTGAEARLIVCVDDDDPTLSGYRQVQADYGFDLIVGPARRFAPWLNTVGVDAAEQFDAVCGFGDDVVPRTPGWDQIIAGHVRPLSVIYGDDGYQHERLATHAFLESSIIRTLGFYAPPTMQHLYIDNWWHNLGAELGTLTYLPGVFLEHMHPVAGKSEWDDRYRWANSPEHVEADREGFRRYMVEQFAADVERLRQAAAAGEFLRLFDAARGLMS